ncbi:MAG: endonuclease/exonuclease/phosphatase family protein [Rhodobacteraceae bacterium]|nr:endonuclease/exonuclease/phosphatase family protein [Paracoccaceae bacterium]
MTTGPALAWADTLRFATYHASFSRKNPGVLLRDLQAGKAQDLAPALQAIRETDPDVLLLTRVDFDGRLATLRALNADLGFPYLFALKPNTGMPTGRDIDGNGKRGEARDAQGYGWFAGQGGMALLSRLPIDQTSAFDMSSLLWQDLPGTLIAEDDPGLGVQRLSSSGHWVVPLVSDQRTINVLAFAATPPVFDGPEDRNGRRNHDEIALWTNLLDGRLAPPAPEGAFVLLGNANLDPKGGEGLHVSIRTLLQHRRIHDPKAHQDQPTAHWRDNGPGPLRVSYSLPSTELTIRDAGFTGTPSPDQPHRLVWVDVTFAP